MDLFGTISRKELVTGNVFLSRKFLVDEFTRNFQGGARRMGQGLCTAQPHIAGSNWPCQEQHSSSAVEHYEGSADVGKKLQRPQSRETVL